MVAENRRLTLSPLSKTVAEEYVAIFRALSEPIRLEILGLFLGSGSVPAAVLDEKLPVSRSTISYHVRILHEAGLIEISKDGRYYHYHLRRDVFEHFLPGLLERLGVEADD